MSAGTTPPDPLYGLPDRNAAPANSLVPPPVTVPQFAAVRLDRTGLRRRLAALLAPPRRKALLAVALVTALALPLLGRTAQAPDGPPATASELGEQGAESAAAAAHPPADEASSDSSSGSNASVSAAPGAGDARGESGGAAQAAPGGSAAGKSSTRARLVSAPVRIADAEAVRLLRPGDRVDVLASPPEGATTTRARLVAHRARVTKLPPSQGSQPRSKEIPGEGALVVLMVTPRTARDLAGAGSQSQLTVAVW